MRERIVIKGHEKEIKEILGNCNKNPIWLSISLAQRKKIWNQNIIDNTILKEGITNTLDLYRGIVVPADDETVYQEGVLKKTIMDYSVGSYSLNKDIADRYSICDENGNLDQICEDYYSIVIKIKDGEYVNVHQLYDSNDLYERLFIGEEEYYCFPTEIEIIKMVLYRNSDIKGRK